MRFRYAILTVLLTLALAGEAFSQYYDDYPPPRRTRGLGILGGLAGAGIGAAVGEDGGDALPGALIGGAIGALGGSAVGSVMDDEETRQQYYARARQRQVADAVTIGDVISMSQSGLGDDVIITQIESRGLAQRLTTNDLILLKRQGVNDRVINTMQRIPGARPVARRPAPVYVEQEYYYAPSVELVPVWPHHHCYPHSHHHHHSGFYFHFGN
jgi:hypothetical protein